ncbi:hypothetical protein TspCOW1_02370 [Thiohalobacter sp. COW1]|uniref:Eco57I restriction-modification methylase domain-containing protein n=1 Tax=Thiohalobacter sp. COW1 TaxID=2795687 RepID=UPI001915259F|nr:type IIL restriction-modification enzyme MmeI [Thiohalobacter sp. COW1]BCO30134.1 hypothetical protein TspCOW1_02370 [Thiohalobacter sp. COW1]
MSGVSRHAEWLSLVEWSGPFLAVPVLEAVFPQGIEVVKTDHRQRLRSAYEEWREAVDEHDPQLEALHREWIRLVLEELLEYDAEVSRPREELEDSLSYTSPEHGITLVPDWAVLSEDRACLLVAIHPPGTALESHLAGDSWPASPIERMTLLCRATGVRLGLVTDGERWVLVNAPLGATSSHASWYARLWFQEPVTLQAFRSLLGVRRCFGPREERLEALLEKSLEYQEEVTDTLGQQVRRAVEVLVQALDRADVDRNRELLRDVRPAELYEAGLTVMMRLVFVLSAEERGLLLLGDPVYDRCYAVSPLRAQLADEAGRHGPEVLERRHDAWSRLLAVFRAVYGGIEYENLLLPALGGSLFDPDRFPFLEGRAKGTNWRDTPASPLPIDNRTVLMLLEALQILEQRSGALLLSYKALDVEQIGHVYEGLLEYTVGRVPRITLGLIGSQRAKNPNVILAELESARLDGDDALIALLLETTGRSETVLRNALAREPDEVLAGKVLQACGGGVEFAKRVLPFANLLRTDNWGEPLVYREGSFAVTLGTDRRETGTHYTPKSLTETIVETTLEPAAYLGPAEGLPREEWRLRSTAELLDLKVCDPAMGSGAFLVQVCRWLAERLVEAWGKEEDAGRRITVDGEVMDGLGSRDPMPTSLDDRVTIARRLVAERCLYGVDMNPLAVELAKLSLWLTTLAKGRPFGFLDHNLRCGDSLLGIHRLDQLTQLRMSPAADGFPAFRNIDTIEKAVERAIELRRRLRDTPIRDIRDVEAMARLDAEARRMLEAPERVADALFGEALQAGGNAGPLEAALQALAIEAQGYLDGDEDSGRMVMRRAQNALAVDMPESKPPHKPFHWPLEFPEVFIRQNGGFDAFVGNPPFLGGQRITGVLGTDYRNFLVTHVAEGRRGSADLVAYFFLRTYSLLRMDSGFGLLAVNTIAEGDTRHVGLEAMVRGGAVIHAAYPNEPWPGKAAVVTSRVHVRKGDWKGERSLLGHPVPFISAFLSDREEWSPKRLRANEGIVFQGSIVLGMGFVLTPTEAKRMLESDPKNAEVIFPYLNGKDVNSDPEQRPNRWAINFWDWPEERAREYELPWRWIEERVKPERQRRNEQGQFVLRRPLPERWWQYGEKRPGLYHAIGRGHYFESHPKEWDPKLQPLDKVLVCSLVQNYLKFTLVENNQIYAHKLAVFTWGDYARFSLVSSSIHQEWTRKTSSTMKVDINYSPSDSFLTLALPRDVGSLHDLGATYHKLRTDICIDLNCGLTALYNRFHDSTANEPDIEELRELHREIDLAVAQSYGWDDINLSHDFHELPYLPEKDRLRFTISGAARVEVLSRLSELNRQRYEEEVAQGLHERRPTGTKRARRARTEAPAQASLDFDTGTTATPSSPGTNGHNYDRQDLTTAYPRAAETQASYGEGESSRVDGAAATILTFLRNHSGWHAKKDVLEATGIVPGQWNSAITALLDRGLAERQGERRGARYRFIE